MSDFAAGHFAKADLQQVYVGICSGSMYVSVSRFGSYRPRYFIDIKRVKYSQIDLNLRRSKRDFIIYFHLKNSDEAAFYFFMLSNMSPAGVFLFFLDVFGDEECI